MDGARVVGVGNIYASEALFLAGIRPRTAAHRLSLDQCTRLVAAINARAALSDSRGRIFVARFRRQRRRAWQLSDPVSRV
jgi:formamidopyrimidine-DNA glycosylase